MDNSIRNILKNAGKDPKEVKFQQEMESIALGAEYVAFIRNELIESIKKDYEGHMNENRNEYFGYISISSTYPYKIDEYENDINDLIRQYNLTHKDSLMVYKEYYIFNTQALIDEMAKIGIRTSISLSGVSVAIPAYKFLELIDEANNTKRR